MAATEAAVVRGGAQWRDYRRAVAAFLGGPGLWIAIVAFIIWSFFAERDALVVGIVAGSIFALGAVGLTLIYGVLKFGHFAHGDSMMLAAFISFFFLHGFIIGSRPAEEVTILPVTVTDLPGADEKIWKFSFGYGMWIAITLSAVVVAAMFIAIERVVYRRLRLRKSGIVIFSIASLGLAIAVRSLILMLWGPDPRFYTPGIRQRVDLPLDVTILADQLFVFAAAVVVTVVIYYLLFFTRMGRAMRAMADNPDLARISGINTDRVITWTWIVSGSLVAIAGSLLALQAQLDSQLGFVLLLPLFAAAILGGTGSPQGALVGGLLIGIVQEVAVTFDISFIREGFPGPGYKFSIAFIVLILVLLLRPQGLFGGRR